MIRKIIQIDGKLCNGCGACDAAAVKAARQKKEGAISHGCPGTQTKTFSRQTEARTPAGAVPASRLSQWPIQIKLAPVTAPYFLGAKLLIAADCTAYAYGNFHERFIKNSITLIGCPRPDSGDYTEKLTEIISEQEEHVWQK